MAAFGDTVVKEMSTSHTVRPKLQSAVAALERHGRVVIVGGPKSGKTFLGHELLRHFSTRFTTHIVCSTRKLRKHLDEGRQRILLMDGTLGEVGVDMEEYKVWRALLPRLMTCTDVRHCLVVVTCYPHVLLELQAMEEGSHSFLLKDTCTVSLKEMAEDERKEMLHHFLSDLSMTQQEKHALVERVLKDDISGATFPWCCARLVQRLHNSSLDDPSDVFTCPAESYVTLLHRMLMDPTHGETVAALLCLTMMGLSDFYGNQQNTRTALRELGFVEFSAYTLERAACFLKNFILSEDCSTFFCRVLYDAAGLALGRSHLLPVLLKICDIDFLIKYARVLVKPFEFFLITPLNSKNSEHLMERILSDISEGNLIEISQYLSLQSELFLEKLERHNSARRSGEIQLVQAVDTVHGLSLLYWSAWTGCDWLINWCLDISIKDGKTPPNHLQSAFVWALAERTKSPKVSDGESRKILQSIETFRSRKSSQILTFSLPFPNKTLLFSEQTKQLYNQVTSLTELTYLGNPSFPIPPSALITKKKGESLYLEVISKQVYLALRLLSDTQLNQVDDRDNTVLHVVAEAVDEVCQAGHTDLVSLLLDMGADVNAVNEDGLTALHLMCSTGSVHFLTSMIKHGADVHVTDVAGRTPLHVACGQGSSQCVSVLLGHGADINRSDINGNTALHAACSVKTRETVSLLLERGADINAKSISGRTSLHCACKNGNTDTATLLLNSGADINSKDADGITPLHLACRSKKKNITALLLDHGADINARCNLGKTPLHWACGNGNTDTAALLLISGADINAKCTDGSSPLHWACNSKKKNITALLLDHGADINAKSISGRIPLHWACEHGNTDTAALLLKSGADINTKCTEGITPLHCACNSKKKITTTLLLDHGADINARCNRGRTPLHWACGNGNTGIAGLLLDRGADINARCTDGTTPLHWACKSENTDASAMLLYRGADINARCNRGRTPLHWACEHGNTGIAGLLLDRGADINANCADGFTPLHRACGEGKTDTVALLLDHGSDINSKSMNGLTPLHVACSKGEKDTAALLLDRGADINARSTDGNKPEDCAEKNGYKEMVDLIRKWTGDKSLDDQHLCASAFVFKIK